MLAASLGGCALLRPRAPSIAGFNSLEYAESAQFLSAVESANREVRTGRVSMDSTFSKGVLHQTLKQTLAFDRPDKLRVEFFATALNSLLSLIVVHGGQVEALDAKESKLYRGATGPKNIERVVSVPFAPEELMLWISGKVPYLSKDADSVRVL